MTLQLGVSRDVWLYLLELGEPVSALTVSRDLGRSLPAVSRSLLVMANTRFVAKCRSPHRKNGVLYTVDRDCKVPQGITMQEIRAAMGLEPVARTSATPATLKQDQP